MVPITLGLEALKLLKRFWYTIPIAAMATFLLVQSHKLANRDETIRLAGIHATQLEDRNAVTLESLQGALDKLATLNIEAEARAKRFADTLASVKASEAAMAVKEQRTSAMVARLEASAQDSSKDPCSVSEDSLAALKDL